MKKTLDTYFTLARHSDLAVGLSSIETLIGTIKPAPVATGIKSIFTKNRYIMNTVTGLIVTGSIAFLTWFILPYPGPQKQQQVYTKTDTNTNYQQEENSPPDTIPKNAKTQNGTTAASLQLIPVPVQNPTIKSHPEIGSADTGAAITPVSPIQTPETPSAATNTGVTPKPQAPKPVSCCKPKKAKPLPNQIEEVSDFSYNEGNWAMVSQQCLYGMMNREAEVVVPIEYEKIDKKFKYNNKLWCKVTKNGLYGFIDTEGHEIVPCIYEDLTDFKFNERQWAKAFRDGYMYFINREGKEVKITLKED